ncbi:HAD-superfamily subfamily IB hydrolase, TIGR01490 [Streptomyces sp. DpondAA-F4a]|nr:HAD-superfamily subfamily IB hydrolase, TIGR01490 [Streptomyces sp. DpondAA-F4a]
MAALGWLTPRRRSATARSVLAGEAAAEAARKSTLPADESPLPDDATDLLTASKDTAEPAFPVAGDDRAAAFFDLDNTVMQGAALFHFGRGLYKRKFFQRRELTRFAWQQAWFRLAGVEDPEHMQDARDSALSIVKGHRVSELMSIGEEIYDEYMADRIWPGTRALAQAHLDAGQRVWLVTAAPVETATIISRRLGLTGALGTVAESVDGVYTGRLVGEPLHGPAKAEAVRALAAAEGLDLERCAAYSDSHNDIPMLSLVGHPYAINPDAKLRKHARALDWRLRDYRTGRKAAKVGIPAPRAWAPWPAAPPPPSPSTAAAADAPPPSTTRPPPAGPRTGPAGGRACVLPRATPGRTAEREGHG